MDLNFTTEEEEFRVEIGAWMDENLPDCFNAGGRTRSSRADRDVWYKRLGERGWLCVSWPEEAGGTGWSLAKQYIFKAEAGKRGAPAGDMGVTMIGPLLIEYGTPAQKERYLPKITAAEEMWCQGYSEPNAGSDLAGLALRADRDGDDYVLNGQKIWTSYAHESDMIFCLTRTSQEDKKQNGITFLVAPLDTPGIEIRPIKQMTDESHFFETFFTDARVPVDNVIGEEGAGWTLAKRLLAHERVATGASDGYLRSLDRLVAMASESRFGNPPAIENPEIRQKIARLYAELSSLNALGFRGLTRALQGQMPGPESSIMKLYGSELFQRITDLAMEIEGPFAMLWDDPNLSEFEAGWPKTAAGSRAYSIFSGTSEIQRNILSERVLGMPKG